MFTGGLMTKRSELKEFALEELPYSIVFALLAITYFLSGVIVIVAFLVGMAIYAIRKYDGRIPVGLALALLVASAFTLATGNEFFANQLATYCYYFLVMGVVLLFIEYLRDGDHENNS